MDHSRIYNDIITKRQKKPFVKGYSERHHIIPVSLGGTNSYDNIVTLSAREHFICHLLLVFIHRQNRGAHAKMLHAFNMMLFCSNHSIARYSPSRNYSKLREDYSKIKKLSSKGKNNPSYGSMWINEIGTTNNKKISVGDLIPEGFCKGRRLKMTLWSPKRKMGPFPLNPAILKSKAKALHRWQKIYIHWVSSNTSKAQFCKDNNISYGAFLNAIKKHSLKSQ